MIKNKESTVLNNSTSIMRRLSITVDQNENLEYETHNWGTKIVRIPIMLLLNMLPTSLARSIFLSFSGSNGDTRTVFCSVATHRALEVMYTYPERRNMKKTNISDDFWENFLSNARAVRNRLTLVKKELSHTIKEISLKVNNIKLLSLGSGSARAVFEVIKDSPYSIQMKLIDMSQQAIQDGEKLIKILNLNEEKNKIEFHRDYVQNLENYCRNFNPDIVEMVGLLDYFPKDQAIDLIKKIYKIIPLEGYLITCNVVPNFETPFVIKGINWPLIYRRPEELAELLIKGGFSLENLRFKYEPFKIHCLAIAKK